MERQLALIEPEDDWRLSEDTKAVGRRGLEAARESLRRAAVAARQAKEAREHPPAA
ncbi:MAG: hypothetical protein L0221_14810 [Chloroflexi bacterium]|nr:hypothetical protein [Chloroflexota bacterium]